MATKAQVNKFITDLKRFDNMQDTENSNEDKQESIDCKVNVKYAVQIKGHILSPVVNETDFAGIKGAPIIGLAAQADKGHLKIRVHELKGGWLPYVDGYDWNDYKNGYAGKGHIIDAIECYYETPKDIKEAAGLKKAKYRVAPVGGDYYDWQYDNETSGEQDGYAGRFGKAIDRVQIVIE